MANKKLKIELTAAQWSVLYSIISEVKDKLSWDEETESYTDGGTIIISLDKNEYRALNNIRL